MIEMDCGVSISGVSVLVEEIARRRTGRHRIDTSLHLTIVKRGPPELRHETACASRLP